MARRNTALPKLCQMPEVTESRVGGVDLFHLWDIITVFSILSGSQCVPLPPSHGPDRFVRGEGVERPQPRGWEGAGPGAPALRSGPWILFIPPPENTCPSSA